MKTKILLLPIFILALLYLKTNLVLAADFEVDNTYKTGIGYSVVLPQDKGNIAVPFKVSSKGSYSDFEFMLQQGYYVGKGWGFPASSIYFDPVTEYPTEKYLDHVKVAIYPSTTSSSDPSPLNPEYDYLPFIGFTDTALATGSKPLLLEPEVIKDSTRYKWIQFKLSTGAVLDTDKWYWVVLYTDSNPDKLEEWEFTGMKISSDFTAETDSTHNFGTARVKGTGWQYPSGGEFVGFRIGKPSPVALTKTPIIIIPGIGGSEFKAKTEIHSSITPCGENTGLVYPKDSVIWVNELQAASTGCDDYFDVLKLKSDGQTAEYLDVVLNGTIYAGTYGKMIKFFQDNGYELSKTLFIFPYDWRKDLLHTAPSLDQLINSVRASSGSAKVDIVAHSMGGLVARNYIKNTTQANKVRKLITLGTPYLGSVEFLKALMYGIWVGKNPLGVNIGVNPTEVNDILQNSIGGFELLPTRKYFDFYDGSDGGHLRPFDDQRDVDSNNVTGVLSYDQTKQLLTNLGKNQNVINYAESFHNLDSNLTNNNNVELTTIIGSGLETLGQIKEKTSFNFFGVKLNHRDEIPTNGDEAVPLFSASLKDKGMNLSPNSKNLYVKAKHADLPSTPEVLELIKNITGGNNNSPIGVQNDPYLLNGQQVSVHSPVNIHAYDGLGNHTGPLPNGEFEADIPGSSYDSLEDSKYIWLPEGQFTIKLEAIDKGKFELDLRDIKNDKNEKTTIYQEVPIDKNTRGEIVVDSSISPQNIKIDQDGDGSIDREVAPTSNLTGNQTLDQTPPYTQVSLSGTKGNSDWYTSDVTVSLSPTDNNSGVLRTIYSLDGGVSSQVYIAPFSINKDGFSQLIFMSTDKAGNQENPKINQVKIDKTKPEVQIDADPDILWPPFFQMVKVKVNGSAVDSGSGIISKKFQVVDEYGKLKPTLTDFGQTIKLQAWRQVGDWGGRIYTLKVSVSDVAGNTTDASTTVLVPLFK